MDSMKTNRAKTYSIAAMVILATLLPKVSFATKFANQFTEFELPPQWFPIDEPELRQLERLPRQPRPTWIAAAARLAEGGRPRSRLSFLLKN